MKTLQEMPATLIHQTEEESRPVDRSRAALDGWKGTPGVQGVEPLDDGVMSIHAAVVMVLRRL